MVCKLSIRIFALFIVFLVAPKAFADCPNGAENTAAQAVYDIATKRKTATEIGPLMALFAQSCSNNGFVQLNAAQVMLQMYGEAKDNKTRYELVAQAWKYLEAHSKLPSSNRTTVVVDGQVVTSNPDAVNKIRKQALSGLLYYDTMNVGHHPYLADSSFFSECPKPAAVSDAITISEWVNKRRAQDDGKDTGAMRLLGRLVQACSNEPTQLWRSPARYRAKILITMAERMEDQAQALKLARQARTDIEVYLAEEKTTRFWAKRDAQKLSNLLNRLSDDHHQFMNMPAIPREEWFKAENLDSEAVIMAIGFAFDEKWALQVGAASATDGYKESLGGVGKELGLIYALATKSGYEVKARHMMFKAAERHSEGRYRRPQTEPLKPIPDFIWTWLEKEEK